MIRSVLRFLGLTVILLAAPAYAHDPGLSSTHVTRQGSSLKVTLAYTWSDLAPMFAGEGEGDRPEDMVLAKLGPELTRATDGLVRLTVKGVPQAPVVPVISAGASSPDEVVVVMEWLEVPSGPALLEFPMLSKLPFGHRSVVSVENSDAVALLDTRESTYELPEGAGLENPSATTPVAPARRLSWTSFLALGVEHILTGFDHLCFLLALLLVAPRLRDVLAVVTTFTVAHSITLAAAALGLVSLSPRIVEPLIAASIVYIGVENVFLRRPPRYRLALVFGFGLVHGLGFASALAERLPGVKGFAIVPPLVSFNVGVEFGQLAVAACLVPLIAWARKRPEFVPRLQPAFSLVIAVAGAVWFYQRV